MIFVMTEVVMCAFSFPVVIPGTGKLPSAKKNEGPWRKRMMPVHS